MFGYSNRFILSFVISHFLYSLEYVLFVDISVRLLGTLVFVLLFSLLWDGPPG